MCERVKKIALQSDKGINVGVCPCPCEVLILASGAMSPPISSNISIELLFHHMATKDFGDKANQYSLSRF